MAKVYARVFKIDGGVSTQVYQSGSRNGKVLAERWVNRHYELFCTYRITLDTDSVGYEYTPKTDTSYVIRRRHSEYGITRFASHFDVNDPHGDIEKIERAWWTVSLIKACRFTEAEANIVVGKLRKDKKAYDSYRCIDYVPYSQGEAVRTHTWLRIDYSYLAVCKACGMLRQRIDRLGDYPEYKYYRGGQLQPLPRAPAKTPSCAGIWLTGHASMVEVSGVRMLLMPPLDPEEITVYGERNEIPSGKTQSEENYRGPRTRKTRKRYRKFEDPAIVKPTSEVFTARGEGKEKE